MLVTQIYSIMNDISDEVLGSRELLQEDLTNITDFGTQLFGATSVDNYVRSLVDRIGKVVFVDRKYSGSVPSVYMDSFEFGAVVEKIQADTPEAVENESWELQDGQSYDPNVFYKPTVSAKFFSGMSTFEVDMSFTERQVKSSFVSASQLNAFMTMIHNAIDRSLTVKIDALIMRTINSMTAQTVRDCFGASTVYTTAGNTRCVNLLKLYNDEIDPATDLTVDKALSNPEFIRFASLKMGLYVDRMSKLSTLFNIGGKDRFTSREYLHTVMLTDFKQAANSYLQSDTFHEQFTALPEAETVPYWQGSGTDYAFGKISKINVKHGSDITEFDGILAVMFDRDALGVSNLDRRVTTNYNPKAEFYNNFYKFDAGYFNDANENFVVFYIA